MVSLYNAALVELRSWLANVVRQHRPKRDAFAVRKNGKYENIKINCVNVVRFPIREMEEHRHKICNTFGLRCAIAVWKFRFSFGVQTKTHCLYEIPDTNFQWHVRRKHNTVPSSFGKWMQNFRKLIRMMDTFSSRKPSYGDVTESERAQLNPSLGAFMTLCENWK